MGNALEFSVYKTKNWKNFTINLEGCRIPLKLDNVKVVSDFSERYMSIVEFLEINAKDVNTQDSISIHANISLHGIRTNDKPVRYLKLEKDGYQHGSEMKDSCIDTFLDWCRWLIYDAIPSGMVEGVLMPTL